MSQSTPIPAPSPLATPPPLRTRPGSGRWPLALAAGLVLLSASLIVGATYLPRWTGRGPQRDPEPRPRQQQTPVVASLPDDQTPPQTVPGPTQPAPTPQADPSPNPAPTTPQQAEMPTPNTAPQPPVPTQPGAQPGWTQQQQQQGAQWTQQQQGQLQQQPGQQASGRQGQGSGTQGQFASGGPGAQAGGGAGVGPGAGNNAGPGRGSAAGPGTGGTGQGTGPGQGRGAGPGQGQGVGQGGHWIDCPMSPTGPMTSAAVGQYCDHGIIRSRFSGDEDDPFRNLLFTDGQTCPVCKGKGKVWIRDMPTPQGGSASGGAEAEEAFKQQLIDGVLGQLGGAGGGG